MASLDVSLDDRIKASNKARGGGGQRRRGSGGARGGRSAGRVGGNQGSQNGAQRSQKGSQKKTQSQRQQGLQRRPDRSRQNSRTPTKQEVRPRLQGDSKVLVEGLVSELDKVDVQDIFAPLGTIKSVQINYDINGQSLGTAEVVFDSPDVAAQAVSDYDLAEVDGVPMSLRLATRVEIPKARPQVQRARQSGQGTGSAGQQQNGGRAGGRGIRGSGGRGSGGRGSGGRGSGGRGGKQQQGSNKGANNRGKQAKQQGGNNRKQQKKAGAPPKEEDLDKDLEAYQKGRDGSANTFAGQPERPTPIKLTADAKA